MDLWNQHDTLSDQDIASQEYFSIYDLYIVVEIANIISEKNKKEDQTYFTIISCDKEGYNSLQSLFISLQDYLYTWGKYITKRGLLHFTEEMASLLNEASDKKDAKLYEELLASYLDEYDNHVSISVPTIVAADDYTQ